MPKKKIDKFVSFHTHSDMSTLDGAGRIDAFVKEASERNAKAIAFTDHGTLRGFYQLHLSAKKYGVKPIYGIEFYISINMNRKGLTEKEKEYISKDLKSKEAKSAIKEQEERLQLRKRWHLCAWAKNEVGLKNLFKLASLSNTEGFYYKPRIDLDTLMENGDGLIIGTACVGGIIYDRVINGRRHAALDVANKMRERWGRDLYLEIQPHDIPVQKIANKFALELYKKWGKKNDLLATQDAHYVNKEDWLSHEVLLCIGMNDFMSNPNRFKFDGSGYHYKTRKEMFKTFMKNHSYIGKKLISKALNNTLTLADKIDDSIEITSEEPHLPKIDLGDRYEDDWDCIKSLCLDGWKWRGISKKKDVDVYKERLKFELSLIRQKRFVKYFLVVWDICNFVWG
jgi:DNA polymerase-3 subunit alpha